MRRGRDPDPGDPQPGQPIERGQMGVGVELLVQAAPGRRAEGDVDVRPIPPLLVDVPPELVQHGGEVLDRLQRRGLGGGRQRPWRGEGRPTVCRSGPPGDGTVGCCRRSRSAGRTGGLRIGGEALGVDARSPRRRSRPAVHIPRRTSMAWSNRALRCSKSMPSPRYSPRR